MFKYIKIGYFFLIPLMLFLFMTSKSRSAECSLSFSEIHGNQIYVGETVNWKLDSIFNAGKSYWYGTRDGVLDVNGLDTSLGSYFTQQFGPYQPETIGHYERFIVVKSLQNQYLCQTATVTFDVVTPAPPPAPEFNTTPTPTVSETVLPSTSPIATTTPADLANIKNGDIVRTSDDFKVWRVQIADDGRMYKQWLFGPQVFGANRYSFTNIKIVSKSTLEMLETSYLVSQKGGDGKVYVLDSYIPGKSATKHWIPSYQIFQQYNYKFSSVFYVPRVELIIYSSGANIEARLQSQSVLSNFTANLSEIMLRFLGLKNN